MNMLNNGPGRPLSVHVFTHADGTVSVGISGPNRQAAESLQKIASTVTIDDKFVPMQGPNDNGAPVQPNQMAPCATCSDPHNINEYMQHANS